MQDPFDVLVNIENKSRKYALVPEQEKMEELWPGIAFKVCDAKVVSPVGQITEIIHYPEPSIIPGTKIWMKGIANIRGSLVPIVDLQAFLCGHVIVPNPRSRLLMVEHQKQDTVYPLGLLIADVIGMKQFRHEESSSNIAMYSDFFQPYMKESFYREKERWGVFDMTILLQNPDFLEVTL